MRRAKFNQTRRGKYVLVAEGATTVLRIPIRPGEYLKAEKAASKVISLLEAGVTVEQIRSRVSIFEYRRKYSV